VIDFVFEDVASFEFKEDIVEIWIEQCVEKEIKISGDICFIFCNDTYLLKLNQEYLKHDYFTDVITFDYSDDIIVSGDIFISVDRIADNAKQFGVSFDYELLRVIIHGVLHLCGYKDKSKKDKIQMTSKEDGYLKELRNVEGV
jgi:rRNA maturation RNase YbeY